MGVISSSLSSADVAELQESTYFSGKEIDNLYERFTKLDRSRSGALTATDLHLIPEFSMNPLFSRLIASFGSDSIPFPRFVATLNILHPRASRAEKLKFVFECLDIDGDGFINETDLFTILKSLTGTNLSEEILHAIVKKTMNQGKEGGNQSAANSSLAANNKNSNKNNNNSSSSDTAIETVGMTIQELDNALGAELQSTLTINFSSDEFGRED